MVAIAKSTRPDQSSSPPPRWPAALRAAGRRLFRKRPAPNARSPKVGNVRTITVLAAIADVTVAALIPLSFFLISQAHLQSEVSMRAQLFAAAVANEARRNPAFRNALADRAAAIELDTLEFIHPADADDPEEPVSEQRRIFSADSTILTEQVTVSPPATPLLAVSLPVFDGATHLATVEIARSLRPTVVLTVAVACGSTGLGLLLFMLLRIEPLRMLATANERASFFAAYDLLTALPNRRLFHDRLEQALAEANREGTRVAVFYVDLDHFTRINDLLGNTAGDAALRTVAERLRGCLRAGDTLARLGGDEFGIIQSILNRSEHAGILGQRVIAAMATPVDIDGQCHLIGISVGVVVSDIVVPSPADQLMKQANMAVHQAKQEGRGRVCFFAPDLNVKLRERHTMETELRTAIAGRRLVLHYQPQVDLITNRVRGAEALVRWNRPGHGMVPPDRFIGLAEETGLIVPIGAWVLKEACRRAATWPEHIGIAVNVSTVQLRQPGFCETVAEALRETGLSPSRLELELTESVLMQDTPDTLATLQRLRNLGTKLAMDDFGTGYSSLGYLQKFRFDKIKIDRSFVSRMGEDANANAIVRAVVAMTEALGVRANAEGVETIAQAKALRATGCAEAQGFLYSRPLPGSEFDALVHGGQILAPLVTDPGAPVAVAT